MSRTTMRGTGAPLLLLTCVLVAGCSDRAQDRASEAARDGAEATKEAGKAAGEAVTGTAGKVGDALETAGRAGDAALETLDVKAALIADDRISASDINVDTNHTTRVVVLKGTVPTRAQVTLAGEIATAKAVGYRVRNELKVR